MALLASEFEGLKVLTENLTIPCQLSTNTTVASQRAFSRYGGARLFTKTDGQTITATDAVPGFTTADLDDTGANSIIGIIIPVADCTELLELSVHASSITATTVSCSAIAATKKGASSTGTTASGNISAILTLTGCDADSATGSVKFTVVCRYRKTQPK